MAGVFKKYFDYLFIFWCVFLVLNAQVFAEQKEENEQISRTRHRTRQTNPSPEQIEEISSRIRNENLKFKRKSTTEVSDTRHNSRRGRLIEDNDRIKNERSRLNQEEYDVRENSRRKNERYAERGDSRSGNERNHDVNQERRNNRRNTGRPRQRYREEDEYPRLGDEKRLESEVEDERDLRKRNSRRKNEKQVEHYVDRERESRGRSRQVPEVDDEKRRSRGKDEKQVEKDEERENFFNKEGRVQSVEEIRYPRRKNKKQPEFEENRDTRERDEKKVKDDEEDPRRQDRKKNLKEIGQSRGREGQAKPVEEEVSEQKTRIEKTSIEYNEKKDEITQAENRNQRRDPKSRGRVSKYKNNTVDDDQKDEDVNSPGAVRARGYSPRDDSDGKIQSGGRSRRPADPSTATPSRTSGRRKEFRSSTTEATSIDNESSAVTSEENEKTKNEKVTNRGFVKAKEKPKLSLKDAEPTENDNYPKEFIEKLRKGSPFKPSSAGVDRKPKYGKERPPYATTASAEVSSENTNSADTSLEDSKSSNHKRNQEERLKELLNKKTQRAERPLNSEEKVELKEKNKNYQLERIPRGRSAGSRHLPQVETKRDDVESGKTNQEEVVKRLPTRTRKYNELRRGTRTTEAPDNSQDQPSLESNNDSAEVVLQVRPNRRTTREHLRTTERTSSVVGESRDKRVSRFRSVSSAVRSSSTEASTTTTTVSGKEKKYTKAPRQQKYTNVLRDKYLARLQNSSEDIKEVKVTPKVLGLDTARFLTIEERNQARQQYNRSRYSSGRQNGAVVKKESTSKENETVDKKLSFDENKRKLYLEKRPVYTNPEVKNKPWLNYRVRKSGRMKDLDTLASEEMEQSTLMSETETPVVLDLNQLFGLPETTTSTTTAEPSVDLNELFGNFEEEGNKTMESRMFTDADSTTATLNSFDSVEQIIASTTTELATSKDTRTELSTIPEAVTEQFVSDPTTEQQTTLTTEAEKDFSFSFTTTRTQEHKIITSSEVSETEGVSTAEMTTEQSRETTQTTPLTTPNENLNIIYPETTTTAPVTRHKFSARFKADVFGTTVIDTTNPSTTGFTTMKPTPDILTVIDDSVASTLSIMNMFTIQNTTQAQSTNSNPTTVELMTTNSTTAKPMSSLMTTARTTKKPKTKSKSKKKKPKTTTTTTTTSTTQRSVLALLDNRPVLRNLAALFINEPTTTKKPKSTTTLASTTAVPTVATTTITTAAPSTTAASSTSTTSSTTEEATTPMIEENLLAILNPLTRDRLSYGRSLGSAPRDELNAITPETSTDSETTTEITTENDNFLGSEIPAEISSRVPENVTENNFLTSDNFNITDKSENTTSQFIYFDYKDKTTERTFHRYQLPSIPAPTTRAPVTIGDYFVYGIYPNNTIVRKRARKTFDYEIYNSPYIIFGILPNNTIIRRFPNGTIIMEDDDIMIVNDIHDTPSSLQAKLRFQSSTTTTSSTSTTTENSFNNEIDKPLPENDSESSYNGDTSAEEEITEVSTEESQTEEVIQEEVTEVTTADDEDTSVTTIESEITTEDSEIGESATDDDVLNIVLPLSIDFGSSAQIIKETNETKSNQQNMSLIPASSTETPVGLSSLTSIAFKALVKGTPQTTAIPVTTPVKPGKVKYVAVTPGVVVSTSGVASSDDVVSMSSEHVQKVTRAPYSLPDDLLTSVIGNIGQKASSPALPNNLSSQPEPVGDNLSASLARRIIALAIERSMQTSTEAMKPDKNTGRMSQQTESSTIVPITTTVSTTEIMTSSTTVRSTTKKPKRKPKRKGSTSTTVKPVTTFGLNNSSDYVKQTEVNSSQQIDEINDILQAILKQQEVETAKRSKPRNISNGKPSANTDEKKGIRDSDLELVELLLKTQSQTTGSTTPKTSTTDMESMVENQIRLTEAVREAARNMKSGKKTKTGRRRTTTTTQRPPLFGGLLNWFGSLTRNERGQTTQRPQSKKKTKSIATTPSEFNVVSTTEKFIDDQSSGEQRGQLVTAAIDVTKAVSKFMGTVISNAAQSFQSFVKNNFQVQVGRR